MTKRVTVFEGEGAAPEAMEPTVELLEGMDLDLDLRHPPVDEHADELLEGIVPSAITEAIGESDAILFGAAQGAGGWLTHMPILKYIRTEYAGGLPANVRPARYFEGATSPLKDPEGIDYAIVRENLEGTYFGKQGTEGDISELQDAFANLGDERGERIAALDDGTYAIRVVTERNTRRLASIVCEYAKTRFDHRPVTLTCATKSNVVPMTDGLFESVVEEIANEHDSIEFEHLHVDNAGQLLVSDPQRFDVVVTTNAPGDILSDIGGATVGGLGLAPSGSFGEDAAYFEPVHGTAPDIEGQGVINPTATILSAGMMLEYLGFHAEARRLQGAIERVYRDGDSLTPDQGGSASTTEMVDAIESQL